MPGGKSAHRRWDKNLKFSIPSDPPFVFPEDFDRKHNELIKAGGTLE
jgi:hypothetical protein